MMINSVKRALSIIDCFANGDAVLGNSEIAERLNLNTSTTHHLVNTLCNEGVLIRDASRRYRLGWKLLEWQNNVMFQQDIYARAMPIVKRLTERYEVAAHIGMYDKGDVVFVLKSSSIDPDEIPTYLGARKKAHSTSTGKALLAFNKAYLKETISRGLVKSGRNTITEVNELKRELALVRERGYAISNDENETSTYAIAAPIQSYSGETIASLSTVGSIQYMESIDTQELIRSLLNIAREISREIGYLEM